jgi:hypothetical protein
MLIGTRRYKHCPNFASFELFGAKLHNTRPQCAAIFSGYSHAIKLQYQGNT